MKRIALLKIRGNQDTTNEIYSQFHEKVDKISSLPSGLEIITDEASIGFLDLMQVLETNRIDYSFFESREYTKQELKEANFFHVGVHYPWEHDALKDAEHYGTKYEFVHDHRCEHCGKIQASELKLDVKKIGKNHFVHIRPEFIITDYAKEVIESNQLSGYEILPARDYKDRDVQKVYQLVVKNILPPIDDQVRIDPYEHYSVSDCEYCSSKGFPRSEFIYRKEEMEQFQDFNLTFEYLNAYRIPLLIVSAKVKELFQKHKIKLLRPEPVRFI
ncbi:hypothetical protein [Paenibacillus sp. Soil787]|uniref:hypothetical protein n=1 Tax=Paenibacillus sp. Soil787 TaxID=1736411 RepID=UPI000703A887|nr:hypothetical protein [Paenibacillus sp. Soil787]KRF27639.1 hypothetical protein ASG93_29285 [Paenibacillus sp. Soil787]